MTGCGPRPDAGFTIDGEPPVCIRHGEMSHRAKQGLRFQTPDQVAKRPAYRGALLAGQGEPEVKS